MAIFVSKTKASGLGLKFSRKKLSLVSTHEAGRFV
jgi:hypothetical protein